METMSFPEVDLRYGKNRLRKVGIAIVSLFLIMLCGVILFKKQPSTNVMPEWIQQELIKVDGAARRGTKLDKVTAIAVHYVGNPNTTAMQNRNYFNQPGVTVSSHFIVGLEGEVVQCVPIDEISSATNHRNRDTISIEVCHPDASGQFSEKTYASLVRLVTWLCRELELDETDLLRHYDVTGKMCPLYYVKNPQEWENFCAEIGRNLSEKS